MTRILIILDKIARPYATGIDMYYSMLLKWLPRLAPDLDFTVLSFAEPIHKFADDITNIRHHSLPMTRRGIIIRNALSVLPNPLSRWVKNADLVHLMMPMPLRISNPRIVATIYDLSPLLLPQIYPWYARVTIRRTIRRLQLQNTHFLTISCQTEEDLIRLFNVENSRVHPIHIGVDEMFQVPDNAQEIEVIRHQYQLPDRYFLYTGSMHKRKNLSTLLEAFARFKETDHTNTKLVLAGRMELGGDLLLQRLKTYRRQSQLILLGYVPAPDLPKVIAGAKALLYPSLYEGFGLPALEAMRCGTPVIASTGGAIPETTGGYAHLCEPIDVACFAQQMKQIVQDGMRPDQILAAREWAKQFSWETTASQTVQVYRTLLS